MNGDQENTAELSQQLSMYVHDLFTESKYQAWVDGLTEYKQDHWYSVIVELDRHKCPLYECRSLGEEVYSKFVFRCIPSPKWKKNKELIILFVVADTLWNSVINYKISCY